MEKDTPAQASAEERLSYAQTEIQALWAELRDRDLALRERVFTSIFQRMGNYDGQISIEDAISQTKVVVAYILGEEPPQTIHVTPDSPLIPLEDLRQWIVANMPPLDIGLAGNAGDFSKRRMLSNLASHFGIAEVNTHHGGPDKPEPHDS